MSFSTTAASIYAKAGKAKASRVIGVGALPIGERAKLRSFTLLAASRLQDSWSVSELFDNADCVIHPPVPGESMGTIEVALDERNADKTMMFEVLWPLADAYLADILNRVSVQLATHDSRTRGGWMRNLLGGGNATVKSGLAPPPDLRSATDNVLARFGKAPATPSVNLLLVGSPGSGKTTAVAAVSDIPIRATEVAATDAVLALKSQTTIALDYGECDFGLLRARLYGTPGQLRFAHMIRQVLATANGILVLVDATRPDPYDDVRHYLEALGDAAKTRPLMVAYTHTDRAEVPRDLRPRLQELLGRSFPALTCDPRDKSSVRRVIFLLANEARIQQAAA